MTTPLRLKLRSHRGKKANAIKSQQILARSLQFLNVKPNNDEKNCAQDFVAGYGGLIKPQQRTLVYGHSMDIRQKSIH